MKAIEYKYVLKSTQIISPAPEFDEIWVDSEMGVNKVGLDDF